MIEYFIYQIALPLTAFTIVAVVTVMSLFGG